jgi:hypothetical protein
MVHQRQHLLLRFAVVLRGSKARAELSPFPTERLRGRSAFGYLLEVPSAAEGANPIGSAASDADHVGRHLATSHTEGFGFFSCAKSNKLDPRPGVRRPSGTSIRRS